MKSGYRIVLSLLAIYLSFACLSSENGTLAAPTDIRNIEIPEKENSVQSTSTETTQSFHPQDTQPAATRSATTFVPDPSNTEPLPSITSTKPPLNNGTEWTDCSNHSFGTMLLCNETGKCLNDWIRPIDVLVKANDRFGIKGMAATGAPSDYLRDHAFGKLPGWTRSFLRGTYESLINVHNATKVFGMEDMYECFGYGPESAHQAGTEALDPLYWVPKAEALAEEASKCLIYGPAVQDYERMSTPEGESQYQENQLSELIAQVAPHVDIWIIQLAKYQTAADNGKDYDGNLYTIEDFEVWITNWIRWIKGSNQNTKVWVQLGIGQSSPNQVCQPPQPPEYILEYREILIRAGVDGVFVMPSMPCQYSDDPQEHEYYLQSLATFDAAIQLACEKPISTSSYFEDVPLDYPYSAEINLLYEAGYTSGCSSNPLRFCPDQGMTRAESAVFLERSIHGVDEIPIEPETMIFADISMGEWYTKWVEALWMDGLTAGCRTDPIRFCPLDEQNRAEGSVFSLRLLHGNGYVPPSPTGVFVDVDLEKWYAPWIEAAYHAGLIEACTDVPEPQFCPEKPLTRSVAAYMIVQAKGLRVE